MSLERSYSRASSGSRGPPPTPPPTYLWEELRRSRSRGGYPWTILSKPPLPNHLDIEELLKGGVPIEISEFSNYSTGKRAHIRNRAKDRERSRRARSEPTGSIPISVTDSLDMDQAAAIDSLKSDELDDFPFPNEDIPDFVMAYLQSDKGNLDENIPDHILEYIQSRAAILERNQHCAQQYMDDEIVYTQDELRIINQARRRLEEKGELDADLSPRDMHEDVDAFDGFFQRAAADNQGSVTQFPHQVKQEEKQEKSLDLPDKERKKSGRFNFKNINVPNKAQLNIRLPKFGSDKKKSKHNTDKVVEDESHDSHSKPKQRRTQSSSPMRQKIDEQLKSWNNSLKKFKSSSSGRNQDGQVKSFIALLPGRSGKKTQTKETENQYEEVGNPLSNQAITGDVNQKSSMTRKDHSISKIAAESTDKRENEGEETMDEIENLPESEEIDATERDGDGEMVIVARGEFVDIDIDEDFEEDEEEIPDQIVDEKEVNQNQNVACKPDSVGFAARSKKAFEMTKTKIQTGLSKTQLQATRNKLQTTLSKGKLELTRKKMQTTLSKHGLQATRDRLQSTLSKENLQATRNKIQSSITNTLYKKNTGKKTHSEPAHRENIFPEFLHGDERQIDTSTPIEKQYETSTPVERKTQERFRVKEATDEHHFHDTSPPIVKQRTKKTNPATDSNHSVHSNHISECQNIEEEAEEDLEDELEPKLEFSIHGTERQRPSSVSQSTETLPEESDKENVIVRPKRQRYRHRRHGFHEDLSRPHSVHSESNSRSSWVEKRTVGPSISQEVLSTFCAPVNSLDAVNSNWGSSRKPDKPTRSRTLKKLSSTSDTQHIYSNVPPRRKKIFRRKMTDPTLVSDDNTKTWPRENRMNSEVPRAPKRYGKFKNSNKSSSPTCSNYQTWPRRSLALSPPTAPKRMRSKLSLNNVKISNNLLKEQTNKPLENILTDADTLFGIDSRFIDEEVADLGVSNEHPLKNNAQPHHNVFSEHATQEIEMTDNCNINHVHLHEPVAPRRKNQGTGSLFRKAKQNKITIPIQGEKTWPRTSKVEPSVPQRRRNSTKQGGNRTDTSHLDLEKPLKKVPVVPASTPSEDNHETSCHPADMSSASSIQAGLDHILEILASTFPQESNTTQSEEPNTEALPVAICISQGEDNSSPKKLDEIGDENPYAEIKQFQIKSPPPRPPPPIYAPATSTSYSYIYTVPRRKKGVSSVSPERPPRTYCTIRPHRPPRRSRSRTQEVIFQRNTAQSVLEDSTVRRHSFSAVDESKEERDLQAAPIVERMRARPLPAPPGLELHRITSPPIKPARSRTSSLKRQKPVECCSSSKEVSEPEKPVETQQGTSAIDEYEPIENPVQVDEVSIGIQTDPLPEFDEPSMTELSQQVGNEAQAIEINNNLFNHQPQEEVTPNSEITIETSTIIQENFGDPTLMELVTSQQEASPAQMEALPANFSDHPLNTVIPTLGSSNENFDKQAVNQVTPTKKDFKSSDSEIPSSFYQSVAPTVSVSFPSRLQLAELEVEHLCVREVTADRLTVSSLDANCLNVRGQVCQITTSNASGQLQFNIAPRVTTSSLPNHVDEDGVDLAGVNSSNQEPYSSQLREQSPELKSPSSEKVKSNFASSLPAAECIATAPGNVSEIESLSITDNSQLPNTDEPPLLAREVIQPSGNQPTVIPVPTELVEPTVRDLTIQLASLSSRHLINGACSVAAETYTMAQRVAELGLQQLNEQLQRRGIHYDEKEKEDLKAVLLMLLIVVCAIFLLGMGKQRISNHWDFYFPN